MTDFEDLVPKLPFMFKLASSELKSSFNFKYSLLEHEIHSFRLGLSSLIYVLNSTQDDMIYLVLPIPAKQAKLHTVNQFV